MIKFFKLFCVYFCLTLSVYAQGNFSDMENVSSFKCTGTLVSGSINEYNNAINTYTYKDGKIYSTNLNDMFGNITKNPKKVHRLKISEDYITFKDRLFKVEAIYYAWVKIDRKTGEYLLNAKNDYGVFFKRANVKGSCVVE